MLTVVLHPRFSTAWRRFFPASMRQKFLSLGLLSISMAGCASVRVTPEAIRASGASPEIKARVASTWREAVQIMNEFIESQYNLSLPRGRYKLDDVDGLRFETDHGVWPIAVTCDWLGDIIPLLGGQAASLSRGFVVARTKGAGGDRAVDNTLFQLGDGEWKPAHGVAAVTLHETSHLVHGSGLWKNVGYVCEALFLFRRSNNSAETRPRSTTGEFQLFRRIKGFDIPLLRDISSLKLRAMLLQDLLGDKEDHGPYVEPRPEPPLPGPRSLAGGTFSCSSGAAATEQDRWLAHSGLLLEWYAEARLVLPEGKLRLGLERRTEELRELLEAVSAILRRADRDPADLKLARVKVSDAFNKAEDAVSMWEQRNAREPGAGWVPGYLDPAPGP